LLPLSAFLFLWALSALRAGPRVAFLLTLVLGFFAARASLLTSTSCRLGFPPPVRHADREILLASTFPYYYAVRELNRIASPGDRIYLLFCEGAGFRVRSVSYGDWFGDYSYPWVTENVSSAEQLLDKLHRSGFQYVMVEYKHAARFFPKSPFARPFTPIPGGAQIFSDQNYAVVRLGEWRP
jgi:hypothetical protein